MKCFILISFLIHFVVVFSNSTEDKSNLEEMCSKSYFDRLRTTDSKPSDDKQVFHFYRTLPFNSSSHHYWKVTVERSGVNKTLKPVSIEYQIKKEELPEYQLMIKNRDSHLWYTANGFNALDHRLYCLAENLTYYLTKSAEIRSQYVFLLNISIIYKQGQVEGQPIAVYTNDKQFGYIPVFKFFGIVCPEEDESFPSNEAMVYICGVLLFFAIVLPIVDLWLIADRYRSTEQIYDDSRLGSLSTGTSSATHPSEDASVHLPAQRKSIRRSKRSQLNA